MVLVAVEVSVEVNVVTGVAVSVVDSVDVGEVERAVLVAVEVSMVEVDRSNGMDVGAAVGPSAVGGNAHRS